MDNQSVFEANKLKLTDEMVVLLKETAKWSYFLSIVGFIGIGLMILFGALFGVILGNMPVNPYENLDININYYGLIYIVLAIIYIFPVVHLFNFSRKLKYAIKFHDNEKLLMSFRNLKSFNKYIGILVIAIISMYILIFVIGGLGVYI